MNDYKNIQCVPLVSIIMPVYNSELFVGAAIESVINQSFTNFELIIVNDGSKDKSGSICDMYSKKDNRVTVLHKDNGGVCSARNLGIKKSVGKYIAFIDNDDIYENKFLEILVRIMELDNADVVKCGRTNIKINSNQKVLSKKVCSYKKNVTLNLNEFSKTYYELKQCDVMSSVWNGLYRRNIIEDNMIYFDECIKHGNEDIIFNSKCFINCNIVSITKQSLYTHYYRIAHSTSMKFFEDQISTRLDAIALESNIVQINGGKYSTDLIALSGIRECFRILIQAPNWNVRKKQIDIIIQRLDFSVLKNYSILKLKNFTTPAKIDLIMIKYGCYRLYFCFRTLRRLLR